MTWNRKARRVIQKSQSRAVMGDYARDYAREMARREARYFMVYFYLEGAAAIAAFCGIVYYFGG